MTKFGLDRLASVELSFDEVTGWCIRASGELDGASSHGDRVTTAGDPWLTLAALSTTPTVVASEGYSTTGDWHLNDPEHIAWIAVTPSDSLAADIAPSIESVEALMDAEVKWAASGTGDETPSDR
jgi:hypothetical protein